MLRFLKAAQSKTKLEHLAFYLIELCLVQYEALQFKPSMLCASAIYVARCTLQMNPAWTPLLAKHARYEESQIKDCAKMILRYHKAARTMKLNVTYEKYLRPDHSSVAVLQQWEEHVTLPEGRARGVGLQLKVVHISWCSQLILILMLLLLLPLHLRERKVNQLMLLVKNLHSRLRHYLLPKVARILLQQMDHMECPQTIGIVWAGEEVGARTSEARL